MKTGGKSTDREVRQQWKGDKEWVHKNYNKVWHFQKQFNK